MAKTIIVKQIGSPIRRPAKGKKVADILRREEALTPEAVEA